MSASDKEGSGKSPETDAQEERVRIGIEITPGVEITRKQVEAALDQAFGPGHGLRIVSITKVEENN